VTGNEFFCSCEMHKCNCAHVLCLEIREQASESSAKGSINLCSKMIRKDSLVYNSYDLSLYRTREVRCAARRARLRLTYAIDLFATPQADS
jgi:hypothetical protein